MKKLLFLLLIGTFCANAQIVRYMKEFTRPANPTAYTAGDVVTATDSLPQLLIPANAFNSGRIVSAYLMADTVNVANGTFTLFLFSDSLGLGKVADNAAWSPTLSQDSLLTGHIDFTLRATGTASATSAYAYVTGTTVQVPFYQTRRAQLSTGIWGRLTATAGYVPKYSGKIRIVLFVESAP